MDTSKSASSLVSVAQANSLSVVSSYPQYDRATLQSGIAHMSVGGFHRSHQALFLHDYLQNHAENWMIYGIGCLDSDAALVKAMNAQQNLYSLTERSGSSDKIKIIGSLKEFVHAPKNQQKVIDVLSSNDIKIISLTITEKGYCYNSKGDLDFDNPMIKADLVPGAIPVSAIGYLFAAAQQRMVNGGQPVTVMSCDNLLGNGRISSRILLQFADAKDPAVAAWIRENVSFPNSMVDRITPTPTQDRLDYVRDTFGIDDPCAVVSESFIQWILEDHFINGRPELESVGVQFVDSVEPYEKLKVRMLNGSHSALSYLSYLMGYREVDQAMADPVIHDFVRRYMDEDITPTIPDVPGINVNEYKDILIQRFSNPAISDQIQRLAMDGSQKIPNAIVPPLEMQLDRGGSIKWMSFAIAAWYRYLRGIDEQGNPIEITDPMSASLQARTKVDPSEPWHLLAIQEIFGTHLSADATLADEVQKHFDSISSLGTRDALTKLLQA